MMLTKYIQHLIDHPFISFFVLAGVIFGSLITTPFEMEVPGLPKFPISVDAIPNIGENQQIVFTKWAGRSPEEVEDQITYPLMTSLMNLPGLKTIRSHSMFGFSSIHLIFEEGKDFFWCRSRIAEQLNTLPSGFLPMEVQPKLGPTGTAVGQIFWYTLESQDSIGQAQNGWDLQSLRHLQDYYVRYGLQSVEGVAEVSSIGGFVQSFQVNLNPAKMKAAGVVLEEVVRAIQQNNRNASGNTIEVNRMEYLIRGLGSLDSLDELTHIAVKTVQHTPIYLGDLGQIVPGTLDQHGILDKNGQEAVGGVVTIHYDANPQEVIKNIRNKIKTLSIGLPQKTLPDGTKVQVKIVPFYNRSEWIGEQLKTLKKTLWQELLIAFLVIFLMMRHWSGALMVASILPLTIGATFIIMKFLGIQANVVALAGIAIAIGSMVDMGIIWSEHLLNRWKETAPSRESLIAASREILPAILTATGTTILSFLPILLLQATEGKLFSPLAFTKTIALGSSFVVLFFLIPIFSFFIRISMDHWPKKRQQQLSWLMLSLVVLMLAHSWLPFGPLLPFWANLGVVLGLLLPLIFFFQWIQTRFQYILHYLLQQSSILILLALIIISGGILSWKFLDRGYVPVLNEGTFLLMPSTIAHAGISENKAQLQLLDRAISKIPEVEYVIGKAGRAESALDPAPLSMYEILIQYKEEFGEGVNGKTIRNWRKHIRHPGDIWEEINSIVRAVPGITIPPKLQPIEARLIMLQTGMQSNLGVQIKGNELKKIDTLANNIAEILESVEGVEQTSITNDQLIGKPYLELELKRPQLARFGLSTEMVQQYIELALGGNPIGQVLDGRNRYPIVVQFPQIYLKNPEALAQLPILLPSGQEIKLGQLVAIHFRKGPQLIKGEDGFLTQNIVFAKRPDVSPIAVVKNAQQLIDTHIKSGQLNIPVGCSFEFAGSYQDYIRSQERMGLIIAGTLVLILLVLFIQFQSLPETLIILSGIIVALAGGFITLFAYNSLGLGSLLGIGLTKVELNITVWVGFLALFGLATDDGVLMTTYIKQALKQSTPKNLHEFRYLIVQAGFKRVKPAMMTTATTLLALLPILMASGRGSELMQPMAIPLFGGMLFQVLTVFIVPVLYYYWHAKNYRYE